jgi:hypothetical protein
MPELTHAVHLAKYSGAVVVGGVGCRLSARGI